jgi:hypothetical protein
MTTRRQWWAGIGEHRVGSTMATLTSVTLPMFVAETVYDRLTDLREACRRGRLDEQESACGWQSRSPRHCAVTTVPSGACPSPRRCWPVHPDRDPLVLRRELRRTSRTLRARARPPHNRRALRQGR